MKKITAILVAIMVVFALAACSENNSNTDPETSKPESTVDNTNTESNKNSSDSSQTDNGNNPSDNDIRILQKYWLHISQLPTRPKA